MIIPQRVTMCVAAITACVSLMTCRSAHAAIPLVSDGASDYVVVLSRDASPSERWAAEEFVAHIKQMSGAVITIRQESAAGAEKPGKAVIVGYGRFADGLGIMRDESLGDEGFIIKSAGPHLVIAGGRRRGTLYGVYTLLEKLGCRWWTPTESTIPTMKTITISDMDYRDVPALEYRDMMYGEMWSEAARLWAARNKVNGMAWQDSPDLERLGGRYRFIGNLVHSYNQLMTSSGMDVKPEMWALRGGQRRPNSQPCLTNPDALKAITTSVIRHYRENPDAGFVVVGQNDNRSYCECENCAAIDEREESHSGQVIYFANKVAEAVEKEIPGAEIATAAYSWSRQPPKSIKPRHNVRIVLCSIECDFAHPLAAASNPENKQFKEDIEGWSRIAPMLLIWHYIGNRDHYLMPNPDLDSVVPNIRFFVDNKVVGIFEQGTHVGVATEFAQLKMWLLGKALWNPRADGKALIAEFLDGYYGQAGPAIQRYIDVIHSTGRRQDFHLGRRVRLNAPFLRPDVMAEAEVVLRKAEASVKGDPVLERRVRHAHLPIWYVLAKRGPQSNTWRAVEAEVGALDPVRLAASIGRVVEESSVTKITDPDPVEPWLNWLQGYARLLSEGRSVVPPELAGADPGSYRLIQACQMDSRAGWWGQAEGASDGWAARVPMSGWFTRHFFSSTDDFTPGKRYKLFVRARGDLVPGAEGNGWQFGVYPDGPRTVNVSVDQTPSDGWAVFETDAWMAQEGQGFWTALARPRAMEAVLVDCMWLVEVPEK